MKILGVYSSYALASDELALSAKEPGFLESPSALEITERKLNSDLWEDTVGSLVPLTQDTMVLPPKKVFLLWHTVMNRDDDSENDIEDILGIYRTEEAAKEAEIRFKRIAVLDDILDSFSISKYHLNQNQWSGGYFTAR